MSASVEGTTVNVESSLPAPSRRAVDALRAVALITVLVAVIRAAWLSDDALITLRSALNISHGWGAGYNATEVVQAYTHPLWFVLWLGLGSVTDQWIIVVLILSVILSGTAVGMILWATKHPPVIVLAAGALALSNAFVEYATSGLENPLGYALGVAALLQTLSLRGVRTSWIRALLLGLTIGGLVLTRMDFALLLLPVGLLVVWSLRKSLGMLAVTAAAAAGPVLLWFLWTWLTYATVLPNTFTAKRNLDIPAAELLTQGVRYLWVSIDRDPITGVILLLGAVIVGLWGTAVQRCWGVGIAMYLGYVVAVGGDFMAGRFLAVPVCLMVAATVTVPSVDQLPSTRAWSRAAAAAAGIVVIASLLTSAQRTPTSLGTWVGPRWDMASTAGVADERGWYLQYGRGLEQWLMTLGPVQRPFMYQPPEGANPMASLAQLDAAARDWPEGAGERLRLPAGVGETCWLGAAGLTTGPEVHWIDVCGLSDRVIANLPFVGRDFQWRSGHFIRPVPEGYGLAIKADDPSFIGDEDLRAEVIELWSQIR